MAQGMFGSPIGTSAATTDAFHAAQTENALAQAAMRPYMAREHAAKAEAAELALTAERRYQAIAEARRLARQAGGPQQPAEGGDAGGEQQPGGELFRAATEVRSRMDGLIDQAETEAQDRFDAGQFDAGSKAMNAAAQARARTAATTNSMTSAAVHQLQAQREASGLIARHMNPSVVSNDLTYQDALRRLPPQVAKSLPPEYPGPEGVKAMYLAGLSAHEGFTAKHQELTRAEAERTGEVRRAELAARTARERAQTSLTQERERVLRREGSVGAPIKPDELSAVTDRIATDFEGGTPEERKVIARGVIDNARAAMRRNPGLTRREAEAAAYLQAKKDDTFAGFQPRQPGAPKPKAPAAVGVPSKKQEDDAVELLIGELPDLADDKDLSRAGQAVAAKARAILARGKAPDWQQALVQGLEETIAEGSLPIAPRFLGLMSTRKDTTGRTPESARTLPASDNLLIPGHYYTKNGSTAQYKKDGTWGPVVKPK